MAETTELVIALLAKDLASEVLEKVGGKIEGLGHAGEMLAKGVAIGAGAVAGAVTTAIAFANATADAALEVRKLERETGMGAEAASIYSFAAQKLGIDQGVLSKSFGIFSKNLETHADTMKKLGVETVKNNDGTIDLLGTVSNLSEKFAKMPDGVEKTALAMQIFGKGGKDMIPILNQGEAGMQAMSDEAATLGLVFTQQGVDASFKYSQAQKKVSDELEGLRNRIGLAVMPALAQLFGFLGDAGERILPPLFDAIGKVVDILGEMFGVITGSAPDAGAALTDAVGPEPAKAIMGALASVRDIIGEVSSALGDLIGWLTGTDELATTLRGTLGFLAQVAGVVLGAAWTYVTDIIKGFIAIVKIAVDWIKTIVQNIDGMISAVRGAADFVGGALGNIHIPGFQVGGTVERTGLALVHAGERVIPAGGFGSGDAGGGASITINIGSVDSQRRVDEISQSLYRAYRMAGGRL